MTDAMPLEASAAPTIGKVGFSDLGAALKAGWRDITRAPLHGLFSITVMALPMLLDRAFDFITARILSFHTVTENLRAMHDDDDPAAD